MMIILLTKMIFNAICIKRKKKKKEKGIIIINIPW